MKVNKEHSGAKAVMCRTLACLLIVAMMICAVPAQAFAAGSAAENAAADTAAVTASADMRQSLLPVSAREAAEDEQTAAEEGKVSVIVELGDGCLASFDGSDSLSEYSTSADTVEDRAVMAEQQRAVQEKILEIDPEAEFRFSYTNLLNGFAAEVDSACLAEITDLPEVADVSRVGKFSAAETETAAVSGTVTPFDSTTDDMIHTAAAWDKGYTGAGKVVAVFDTTLRHTHRLFSYVSDTSRNAERFLAKDDVAAKINANADSLNMFSADTASNAFDTATQEKIKNGGYYVSEKVPFALDYADGDTKVNDYESSSHGTHVSGIIAGNPGPDASFSDVRGIAYDAQIMFFKVFPTQSRYATDDTLLAALEDAVTLGADAFNLSLGSYYGPATSETGLTGSIQKAFTLARKSGINVCCSAGNSGRSDHMYTAYGTALDGYSSEMRDSRAYDGYSYYYGNTKTLYPNAGAAVGFPSTFNAATSVASAMNEKLATSKIFRTTFNVYCPDDEDLAWPVSGVNDYNSPPFGLNDSLQKKEWIHLGNKTVETAMDEGMDLNDKVVLVMVKYGEGSAQIREKQRQLYNAGAAAAIFYLSRTANGGSFFIWDSQRLPALGFVTYDQGSKIAAALDKNVKVAATYDTTMTTVTGSVPNPENNPNAADYSSWGTTEELTLKPEIMMPGTYVMSAGGSSDTALLFMSGTSMAAPAYTGATLLVQQYVEDNAAAFGLNAGASDYLQNRADLVDKVLASSAEPYRFPLAKTDDEDAYLSPRKQGAGLVQMDRAVASDTVLHNGKTYDETTGESSRTKLELGDQLGSTFQMTVQVANLSSTAQSYDTTACIQTEAAVEADGTWYQKYFWLVNSDWNPFTGVANVYQLFHERIDGATIQVTSVENATLNDGTANVNIYSDAAGAATVTVPANTTATVTLTVTLPDMSSYEKQWPNGQFLEGYIFMDTDDAGYSIPYLGFYGDWTAAPIIDNGSIYESYESAANDDYPAYYLNELRASGGSGKDEFIAVLGANQFTGEELPLATSSISNSQHALRGYFENLREGGLLNEENIAFSPNDDGFNDAAYAEIDLLRYADTLKVEILDKSGNVVRELTTLRGVRPTSVDGDNSSVSLKDYAWDGLDSAGNPVPDGMYTYRCTAWIAYGDSKDHPETLSFPLRVDRTAPVITNLSVEEKEDKTLLCAKVSDDHALQAYCVYYDGAPAGDSVIMDSASADISFDITAIASDGGFDADKLSLQVTDYAMNLTDETVSSGDVSYVSNDVYTAEEQAVILNLQKTAREVAEFMLDDSSYYYPADGFTFDSTTGEWAVVALGRSYFAVDQSVWETYESNATEIILKRMAANDYTTIDQSKRTENSRAIVGLGAINVDPTDIDGHTLLTGLENLHALSAQGANSLAWALIALDSRDYPDPEEATATRDRIIDDLLKQEVTSKESTFQTAGGWAIKGYGSAPDIDTTAMVIQALAPYYKSSYVTESGRSVREYVDRAMHILVRFPQDEYGAVGAGPESVAWAMLACMAMDIDPLNYYDENGNRYFVNENGKTLLDGLLSYRYESDGFVHLRGNMETGSNSMSTEQAMYAMTAYLRFLTGQNNLFDYSDADFARTVAVAELEHGTIEVSRNTAAQGDTVTVTVVPEDGYRLDEGSLCYTQSEGNIRFDTDGHLVYEQIPASFSVPLETADGTASFVMPRGAVELTADFVPKSNEISLETTLTDGIKVNEALLTFEVMAKDSRGEKVSADVTLNGTPVAASENLDDRDVYQLTLERIGKNTIVVSAGETKQVYTVEYRPVTGSIDSLNDMQDKQGKWYYPAVKWTVENGLFRGDENHNFNPQKNITRAEFAQMLYNYYRDDPDVIKEGETCNFGDVSSGKWYYKAISACAASGIFLGDQNGNFNPDAPISRQDAALVMMRIIIGQEEINRVDVDARLAELAANGKTYNDFEETSNYAKKAMAASLGVIFNGDKNGSLHPRDSITRAETAQVMYNYLTK